MFIKQAHALAYYYREMMLPYVERVEVAGSIRRGCQDVKDIELVAIPRFEKTAFDGSLLFDDAHEEISNLLHMWATCDPSHHIRWIKPGTHEIIDWQPKPDGKYWRALLKENIKLDLFLARPDNFGLIYAIRTGSKDFTAALVTHARDIGMPSRDGYLRNGEAKIITREEQDVFDVLHLQYIPPAERTGFHSLKLKPAMAEAAVL
ncbi:MAG TPA: hypothetical protein VGC91_07955 [Pyrinomonadaceae bacterium]|jgi:DNA polymerase/3'-5' exonuclease PolX